MLSRFSKVLPCSFLIFSFCTVYPSTTPIIQPIVATVQAGAPVIAGLHNELALNSLARLAADGNIAQFEERLRPGNLDIDQLDENGLTPLQEAICARHSIIVGRLCSEKSININKYSRQGFTALHYAIAKSQCTCRETYTCDSCRIIKTILSDKSLIVDNPKRACYRILTHIPFYQVPMDEWVTALHIAALNGDIKNTQLLIERGAGVNQLTYWGKSPLHYAACRHERAGSFRAVIEELFKHGACINQEDRSGFTPLHMAIINKNGSQIDNTGVVKCLLERGADINNMNCNQTPLMAAVNQGDIAMVQLLLDNGAKVVLVNAYGCTALDLAITRNFGEIQRCLLNSGAPHTLSKKYLESINPRPKWILYPLHEAADSGSLNRVQMFLSPKSPVKMSAYNRDEDLCTPLHYAARNNRIAIVKYLLSTSVDTNAVDRANKTPLVYATENGCAEIVQNILDQSPEGYLSGQNGLNGTIGAHLLTIAANNNHKEVALELVKHGAVIDNLLIWAVVHNFENVVRHLLSANNTPMQLAHQGPDGKTALDRALEAKNMEIVDLLIKANAVVDSAPAELNRSRELAFQNGLGEFFDNITSVERITAQHREFTAIDKQGEGISLDSPELNGFDIHGFIQPSLQKDRGNCGSDKYSSYYALFNATRAEGQYHLDREAFAHFFEAALTFIRKGRINPPYDNLTTEQLWALLQEIKREPGMFGVANKDALEQIVIIRLDNLDDFLKNPGQGFKAFGGKNAGLLDAFIIGSIPAVTLIVGNKVSPGHWFTIFANRKSQRQVSFDIFDSSLTLEKWKKSLLYNICRSDIIYFYLMITRPIAEWKSLMTKSLELEINKVLSAYSTKPSKSLVESLIEDLDNFVECLSSLRESVRLQATTIDQNTKIIHALRLGFLSREYDLLFNKLLNDITERKMQDSLFTEISTFFRKYSLSVETLKEQLTFLTNNTTSSNAIKNMAKGEIIDSIKKITDDAIALKAKISQKTDSLTNGNFFDASLGSIPCNKLDIIKKHLQPELKAFIQEQMGTDTPGVRGVIFYGDPGNGKTTMAQALAQLCPYKDKDSTMKARPFRIIRVPALGTKYQFSKEEQLSSIYTFMKENPKAVILLDEVDALADSKYDQDDSGQDRSVQVVQLIIDEATRNNLDVIFVGTTNNDVSSLKIGENKRIPDALLSRTQKIKIENPDYNHRLDIIAQCRETWSERQKVPVALSKQDEEVLARQSAGLSIRDLESIFTIANRYAFADTTSPSATIRQITNAHIATAFKVVKKGKSINYWHIAGTALRNVVLYGSPWLNLAHGLYATYIQGLARQEDILRNNLHRNEEYVRHLSEVQDEIKRSSAIHNKAQVVHEAERAKDLYVLELHREEEQDTRFAEQFINTATSVASHLF